MEEALLCERPLRSLSYVSLRYQSHLLVQDGCSGYYIAPQAIGWRRGRWGRGKGMCRLYKKVPEAATCVTHLIPHWPEFSYTVTPSPQGKLWSRGFPVAGHTPFQNF